MIASTQLPGRRRRGFAGLPASEVVMIEGPGQTPNTSIPEVPGQDPMRIGGVASARFGRLLSCDTKRASPSVASLLRRLSAE